MGRYFKKINYLANYKIHMHIENLENREKEIEEKESHNIMSNLCSLLDINE